MADSSGDDFSKRLKKHLEDNEQHVQEMFKQAVSHWETQQKAIKDLLDKQWAHQQKMISGALEHASATKIGERLEADWKALMAKAGEQAEAGIKAARDLADRQRDHQQQAMDKFLGQMGRRAKPREGEAETKSETKSETKGETETKE
jgi:F0F1-type ATP synthase delta subunit